MLAAATHIIAHRPAPWFHRTSLRNAGPKVKLLRVSRRRHEGFKPYWGGSPFEIGLCGRAQCVTVRQLKSQKWFGLRCPLIQRFAASGSRFPFLGFVCLFILCLGPYVLVPSFDWLPTWKQNGCRHSRSFIHIIHTQSERFSLLVKRGLRVHLPMCLATRWAWSSSCAPPLARFSEAMWLLTWKLRTIKKAEIATVNGITNVHYRIFLDLMTNWKTEVLHPGKELVNMPHFQNLNWSCN